MKPILRKLHVKIGDALSVLLALLLCFFFYLSKTLIDQCLTLCGALIIAVVLTIIFWKSSKFTRFIWLFDVGLSVIIASIISASGVFTIDSNEAFLSHVSEIEKSSIEIYENGSTSLYFNVQEKKVYSITENEGQLYLMNAGAMEASQSEMLLPYTTYVPEESSNSEIKDLKLYMPTPLTFNDNEYGVSFTYNNVTYVSKLFLSGYYLLPKEYSHNFLLQYISPYESFVMDVFKSDSNYIFMNNSISFTVPYVNVAYNADDYFRFRFVNFMTVLKGEAYTLPESKDFKYLKSFEINTSDIQRVVFYYEISDGTVLDGILMETVYANGTSDICYVKEIYPENIEKVSVQ